MDESLLLIARVLGSAFLAVLFLQSGLDKVVDRKGNLEWLTGHFRASPLAGQVPALLTIVTMTELAAGVLSAVGAAALLTGSTSIAAAGAIASAASLLMLFVGQRLAKDYAGAAVLVPYFLLALFVLYLLLPRA